MIIHFISVLFLTLTLPIAQADDSKITTIHNLDLSKPDEPSGPNYALMIFDVKKLKVPGSRAHVIFRQFSKRVRLEFEASGIPKGRYRVGLALQCAKDEKTWTMLHDLNQESMHLASEKSLPEYALRKAAKPGQYILHNKYVGLFQIKGKKPTLIDCKMIK